MISPELIGYSVSPTFAKNVHDVCASSAAAGSDTATVTLIKSPGPNLLRYWPLPLFAEKLILVGPVAAQLELLELLALDVDTDDELIDDEDENTGV